MKFSIRDLLLVTVIVALAVGWWVDRRLLHQKLGQLADDLTKLAEENKQLRIQVDLGAIDLAAQSQAFEQYKLKTLLKSSKAPAPAANAPKD